MKLLVKSIGMVVLGIGLLGLTSGCGKKMVSRSSGEDQRVVRASLKASPGGELSRTLSGLAGHDQGHRSQEFDLDSKKTRAAGQASSKMGGEMSSLGGREGARFSGESTDRAILTTPASGSSHLYDSPFTSSAQDLSQSYDESSEISNSPIGHDTVVSRSQAPRKGVTFSKGLRDIYFEFDSWRLTEESRRNLETNAEWLKANPHERITIEGHCDERGTQAYNYVLGEKRATMVHQYLGFLGVDHHQLIVTSFGKDKPKCHTFSEACFQENRRAHFGSDLNVAVQ